jgi:glutathione S-transferase
MAEPNVVLHQFPFSHYNEKARWGLDWKGVAHRRVTYLPGPHGPQIKRLSGQMATPVLVVDGEVVAGSARILDTLDRRFPERPLHPEDPKLRERALVIQKRFDDEVGVAARTVVFSVLLQEPDYLCQVFAGHRALPVRGVYRGLFPLTRPLMARANGVTGTENVERAFARTREALDFVAREVGPEGYLVGGSFSVADLACASLLSVLGTPPHPDMARPRPVPERMADLEASFAPHPAMDWVMEQYRRHRPPSCAVES